MRIETIILFWPYALAAIVLPFVLFGIWRKRHEPKGRDARRAYLAKRREARRNASPKDDGGQDDEEDPALASRERE